MDKFDFSCPGGDCPGLDKGPRSREHDGRFINHVATSSPLDNSAVSMMNDDNAQNRANQRAIL